MDVSRAYSVLGVARGASLGEVRSAYRVQLSRHHPDAGGIPDPAALAEIRSAYREVVQRGVAPGVRLETPRHTVDVYA
jgi:DnaJ-class molecular chaperone